MGEQVLGHAGLSALGLLLVVGSLASVGQEVPAQKWQMGNTAEAGGIKVTFSKPILVGRSKSYLWFPTLVRLGSGELLALMSDYADVNVAESTSQISWSCDGGSSWGPLSKALGSDGSLTLPNGDTLLMPYYLRPMGSGVMGASYQFCPKGSRSLKVIKPGIAIEGWPRPDKSLDSRLGLSGFVCNGQIVPLKDKGYLGTLYGHFRDTDRYSLVASDSMDGVHWKIRSVVADEKCELSGREGPCESALCRLKDGRLLCVFRLDSGAPYGQCFSTDEGRTWTKPTAMKGAFSVQPSLATMRGGLVALSGGRPGLFLWLNPDGMGTTWHKFDVLGNHNAHRPDETIETPGNTSSYTEVVAMDDTQLLYIYDRIPFGWGKIPPESPETNSVWVVRVDLQQSEPLVKRTMSMSREQASSFARLALKCIQKEYPNKPEHVLNSGADIKGPRELHPAFYGSFDWHSSVHGHWMLVRLLRGFPDLPEQHEVRAALSKHLTAKNLQAEADYFAPPNRQSFERTYGWAWLLKLAEELHGWDDPDGRQWSRNLQPLADVIVARYLAFLPKQTYSIRSGVHPNTAFGLSFALDYARAVGHKPLHQLIEERSRAYFANDAGIPAAWEPSGADFFSPSLMEADLMRRVLPPAEFHAWLGRFLPDLGRGEPKVLFTPAKVTDRGDPQLVHLDGLNLSRAWCMRSIAAALPKGDVARKVLADSAAQHAEAALRHVASGEYAGEHWLASFAVYLLSTPTPD